MYPSIATVCLSGTLREKIASIAQAGFKHVEIFENDLLAFDGSVREAAAMIDIDPGTLGKVENGTLGRPSKIICQKIGVIASIPYSLKK